VVDWLERCAWQKRPPEFGALFEDARGVAIACLRGTQRLWSAWQQLPAHRHILGATDSHRLRYAALDFSGVPPETNGDLSPEQRLATCGSVLTRVVEHLLANVHESALHLFDGIEPYLDVTGELRVGFGSVNTKLAPQVVLEERAPRRYIYVIGEALQRLANGPLPSSKLGLVVARCLDPEPSRRYQSLDELRAAFRFAGARVVPAAAGPPPPRPFDLVEQAIGFMLLRNGTRAHALLRAAQALQPYSPIAAFLIHEARKLPIVISGEISTSAAELEAAGKLADAIRAYGRMSPHPAIDASIARCQLGLGELATAIRTARRVLERDPQNAEMHALVMRASLRLYRFADALEAADAWLAHAPDDANAHYTRGRALLGLGRSVEALDAFERASTLDPKLLEAQLLFRETDRAVKRLRATVGTPNAMVLDVPDHLAPLRELVAAGRITDAIRMLRDRETDAVAQRLRGELLAFEARHGDALDAFETSIALADTRAAQLGRARSLLELDRADEALAIFMRFDDPEALEGRARALQQLGREVEAEAVLQCAVAASEHGSELRVRTTRG
jgi:tetratricopeptide (TPR) repeat protein